MDASSMAERFSAAMSSVDSTPVVDTTPADPAPVTPAASTPDPVLDTAAPVPELSFEDDPPELDFDAEPEAAPVAVAPPVTEDPNPNFEGLLPKEVENAFMKTNRGRHLLTTYKSMRDLRAEPQIDPATGQNNGGLGFIPNSEQIREFHRAHSDMRAMEHEFSANPQSFAVNWFAPDAQGNFRDGVEGVIGALPGVLDQIYATANQSGNKALADRAEGLFKAAFIPMATGYLDGLYARAKALPNPQDREYYLNAARALEYDLTGKHRGDDALAPPKPEDALVLRERELADREQRLNAWQTRSLTEQQKQAENQIFQTIDQTLEGDIDKALSSVKSGLTPRAYRAAVADYKAEIQKAVRSNHIGWRDFNFSLSKARAARGADAQQAPVQAYQQLARQAIRNTYRTVLQELADGSVRQNAAQHSTAAAAAANTAPAANGGQPPAQSVVQGAKVTRMPGEDMTDYAKRRMDTVLGRAAS